MTVYSRAMIPRRTAPPVTEGRREMLLSSAGWLDLLPHLIEPAELSLENPAGGVPRLPAWAGRRVALLGYAAPASTPNLGQGGGMAIEDAMVLAKCLATGTISAAASLRKYQALRRNRTQNVQFRSWLIGHVGQWQNRFVTSGRDLVTSLLPSALFERNLRRIYSYET